jgi:hypothetical protein
MMKKLLLFSIVLGNLFVANSQSSCVEATAAIAGINTVSSISGTLVDGCAETSNAVYANWFVYNPTISGIVTITSNLSQNDGITNSDDTLLNVYTGTCGTLTCFITNDDEDLFGGIYLSTVSFVVQPGETYYLEWADEWNSDGFDFEITETIVTCPTSVLPPFTENFTNTAQVFVCWDMYDEDGDGFNWTIADYDMDEDDVPDGNPCLKSASYDNAFGELTPDNWIVSYPIDLTTFPNGTNIELKWLARGIDEGYSDENYTVYVATTNTISGFMASTTTFNEIIGQNGGAGVYAPKTLDISSFYGQMIYVAFRHHDSTDEFELNIDDVAVTATLNTSNFTKNQLKVYPSPVADLLYVTSEISSIDALKIVDVNGRVVKQLAVNNQSAEVNVSDLTAGVYMITIETEKGSTVQKFVKK